MFGRVQERPVHRRTTLCVQSRVDEVVRSSSLLLGGRHVVHVSPSLGCRLSELFSRAGYENAERDQTQTAPAPLWLRHLPDPSPGGAMATLGAAATARRSCILSLTRALQGQCAAAKTWSLSTPVFFMHACCGSRPCKRSRRRAPAISGLEAPRGDTVDAEMRGFNQVQNLLLSRRLRLHHPER